MWQSIVVVLVVVGAFFVTGQLLRRDTSTTGREHCKGSCGSCSSPGHGKTPDPDQSTPTP